MLATLSVWTGRFSASQGWRRERVSEKYKKDPGWVACLRLVANYGLKPWYALRDVQCSRDNFPSYKWGLDVSGNVAKNHDILFILILAFNLVTSQLKDLKHP